MLVIDREKREFIPTSEEGKSNPVTFYVVPPTRKTALRIQDMIQPDSADKEAFMKSFKFSKYVQILLDDCVVGWKNIVDKDNKPIEFNKENLDLVSDIVMLSELANFIESLGKVGK